MRAGNLELGDPFTDLRETIKIIFVRAIKENILIHQVRGPVIPWQQQFELQSALADPKTRALYSLICKTAGSGGIESGM
jgi:hypothetical protein